LVQHIIQIARGICALIDGDTEQLRKALPHTQALIDELHGLNARDFLPADRYEFVAVRIDLELWHQQHMGNVVHFLNEFPRHEPSKQHARRLMNRIVAMLEKYGGEGWRVRTRSFTFLHDAELCEIIERDYRELTLVLFPGGAWKSTVIMAGSILEAIMVDVLTGDAQLNAQVVTWLKKPKGPLEDWTLVNLIKAAVYAKVLPQDRADTFDQVLRDYRNFVHPLKEKRAGHPCGEGEAQLAIGGLNAVCDILGP
jgi:hypothetical protein